MPQKVKSSRGDHSSLTILAFVDTTYNHISRMLSEHHIKAVGIPLRKISIFLWPVRDDLALETPGVLCKLVKEYNCHIHPDKSVVAEHSISMGHLNLLPFIFNLILGNLLLE
jgi:hypothetical protein